MLCVSACSAREQDLSTATDVQTVTKDGSNEVEKIIWEEKDNDHKVAMTTRTPPLRVNIGSVPWLVFWFTSVNMVSVPWCSGSLV